MTPEVMMAMIKAVQSASQMHYKTQQMQGSPMGMLGQSPMGQPPMGQAPMQSGSPVVGSMGGVPRPAAFGQGLGPQGGGQVTDPGQGDMMRKMLSGMASRGFGQAPMSFGPSGGRGRTNPVSAGMRMM